MVSREGQASVSLSVAGRCNPNRVVAGSKPGALRDDLGLPSGTPANRLCQPIVKRLPRAASLDPSLKGGL